MPANSWVVCLRANTKARVRMFCFPYAGGGAAVYSTWTRALQETIELYAIRPPGRESRLGEPPLMRISHYLAPLVSALESLLDQPFVFFGHSLGAIVSFEVARLLRKQQRPTPAGLFVSGSRAPHIPDPDPPIHQLREPAFTAELRRLNGTPEAVLQNEELMQLLTPCLRADFAAVDTYEYIAEPPLSCPIAAFGGLQDHKVERAQLAGWREHTSSAFAQHMLPGDHFFLHSSQEALLQTLSRQLGQLLNGVAEI